MNQQEVQVINCSTNDLPTYETTDSAGMDVRANIPEPETIPAGQRSLVKTGLKVAIPSGYEIQVRPRSGLAYKFGITVLNAPGTIDADYRGEIGVILHNTSPDDLMIEPGERIAQLVLAPVTQISWKEVDILDDTHRGEGGFGSTGTV